MLNYSLTISAPTKSKVELLYDIKSISNNNKKNLLLYLLKFQNEAQSELLKKVYKDLAYYSISDNSLFFEYFNEFLPYFNKNESIDSKDIYLFAIAIKLHLDFSRSWKALNLCIDIDKRLININDEDLRFESSIIYYWFTNIYITINDKKNVLKYANISLKLIESTSPKKSSMIGEEGINKIKDQLIEIKKEFEEKKINSKNFNIVKKHNRNDIVKVKYLDNSIVTKKYKIIEPDLKSGKCQII